MKIDHKNIDTDSKNYRSTIVGSAYANSFKDSAGLSLIIYVVQKI